MNIKNDLVIKDNSLVNACFDLTLAEYRLLHIAFAELSVKNAKPKDTFTVTVLEYSKLYGVAESTASEAIYEARRKLFERKFNYRNKIEKNGVVDFEYMESRWISDAGEARKVGYVTFTLTRKVIEMVGYLQECFTKYKFSEFRNLSSFKTFRIYELVMSWKSTGIVPPITITEFKKVLGVGEDEYLRLYDFKKRVVEPAIKQINKHTDIILKYESKKNSNGEVVFNFSFKLKVPEQSMELKQVKNLTDKQIFMFSMKLAELQEFQNVFESKSGESYSDFAERIAEELTEAENVQKWAKYLEQVGFKC